jgi:urease gamma subunit
VLPSDKWTESISELVEAGILEHARDGAELAELAQRDVAVAERGSVARDLFGIGLPDPDFDAVVAQAKECKR